MSCRLIGVGFDVYDGARPKEKLSSDALKTALKEPPTLLQMFGHSLFPSACLVGPQFSMKRFLDFINGKYHSTVSSVTEWNFSVLHKSPAIKPSKCVKIFWIHSNFVISPCHYVKFAQKFAIYDVKNCGYYWTLYLSAFVGKRLLDILFSNHSVQVSQSPINIWNFFLLCHKISTGHFIRPHSFWATTGHYRGVS